MDLVSSSAPWFNRVLKSWIVAKSPASKLTAGCQSGYWRANVISGCRLVGSSLGKSKWHILTVSLLAVRDQNLIGELIYGVFFWIAQIARSRQIIASHGLYQSTNHILNITERASLQSVAINGYIFVLKALKYEIGHCTPVIKLHTRSKYIKNAHNSSIHLVLFGKIGDYCLGRALPMS